MQSETQPVQPSSSKQPAPGEARLAADRSAAAAEITQLPPDDWEPLPVDPNYKSPGYRHYRHRGATFNSVHLQWGAVQLWAEFRGRPADVLVASFPKSGTTWLQELVWRVVHGESGAGSGSGMRLEYRFPLLDCQPRKGIMEMLPLHEMEDPRLIKTHLPYHLLPASVFNSGAKVLYVSRDARDVCVSNYHFSRLINVHMYRGTFAEYRDSFVRGEMMYGPYREHVKGYLNHADTVLCVTYEQLHQYRASVVRKVATFLDRTLTDEEVNGIVRHTSFEAMNANPHTNFRHWEKTGFITESEGTFMRKGVIGDWRNYFTEEESDAFIKWRNEVA